MIEAWGPLKRYMAKGTSETAVVASDRRRRAVWAAYVASAAALGYAVPHLWWGLGIPWAYPGDFADMTNQSTPQALANWGIGIFVAIVGALFPLALVKPWGRILPRRLLLVPAWVASVVFVLWGLGYFYLRAMLAAGRVVSAPEYAAGDAHPAAEWGFLWYGLFLVWGISLGATAWWSRRTRR